jgi:hypothetical protein
MIPPKDRIWADPFVIFKNERYYIFFEEMTFKENKGKISVISMDEEGNHGSPVTVLEKDYHLSYPFLIEEGDTIYMIPECHENRTIDMYICTEFPLKWKFHKTLIENIDAVDVTIFKHNNKYWMFTNVLEMPGASIQDELFLYYTDDLLNGEWVPHCQNPIISDIKCSRPAGNIFIQNNRIYRPAQNGSKYYGYGMQIREITTLTEESYEEVQIQSIHPNWAKDVIGLHTLNSTEKLTLIDTLIKRRR